MDIDIVSRYVKLSRTAEHPTTPATERGMAQRQMAKMEAQNPGIDRAARLLRRIEDDDLDDPPPPPPSSSPWGADVPQAGMWGTILSNPAVQAAIMAAGNQVGAAGAQFVESLGAGGGVSLPKMGREVWEVIDAEEVGLDVGEEVIGLIVRVKEGALNNEKRAGKVLEQVCAAVAEGLGFDDDDEED